MNQKNLSTPAVRKRGPGALLAILLAVNCGASHAEFLRHNVAIDEEVTQVGLTSAAAKTFFSVATEFDRFDPALGTLNSAMLSWQIDGHVTMLGNLEGQAVLAYNGKSASRNADTDGNPPNDVDFSFFDFVELDNTLVEGLGRFSAGDFVGTVSNIGGFFPWGAQLSARGFVTVTYDYTPIVLPPGTVSEPGSLALLGLSLIGALGTNRRGRR